MSKFLLIGLLLFANAGAFGDTQETNSVLVRNAIVVSDLDASKQFYVNAFGFTPGFDGDIGGEWVEQLLQLEEGTAVRFAILRGAVQINGADVDGAMIGLMQIGENDVGKIERVGGDSVVRGEVVLAVVTENIEAAYATLLALDANVLVPPSESPNGREIELVVRDPDNVRIHVVQRLLDLPDPGNE